MTKEEKSAEMSRIRRKGIKKPKRVARRRTSKALGEAITRLEGLGYSSGCNEWREIWRATQ
jgi:hypothetical protein